MGHRQVSNQFMISGLGQHDNNHSTAEWPCFPMDCRSNEHHAPYLNMEVQRPPPPFSRPPIDPYTHSSTNGNASWAPVGPVGHIHSSLHNHPGIGDITAGNEGPFKRKNPGISEFGDRGSSGRFNGAGSSSSSQMLIQKPPVDHSSLPPYNRGSSLMIDGQDSTRRVRSRSRLELEPCMTQNHVPSYSSHYYQPTAHSTSYSVPIHHPVNLSADVASREWNYVPYASFSHGRTSLQDTSGLRYETSQIYAEGSSVDIDACRRNSFLRRNFVSSFQHPHVSHPHGHVYQSRVTPLYWNDPRSYSNFSHGGTSSTNELQFPSENFSCGYPTHSAGGWDNGFINRRPRLAVDLTDAPDGLNHERPLLTMTVDRVLDMVLDIDNMTYEELLALEERIGDVNTGLSEDGMSKCIMEHVYCSPDQSREEASCPVCLEGYKNGEKVGRVKKCGHEYHVDCIKKWLRMKKLCPICKSECSS